MVHDQLKMDMSCFEGYSMRINDYPSHDSSGYHANKYIYIYMYVTKQRRGCNENLRGKIYWEITIPWGLYVYIYMGMMGIFCLVYNRLNMSYVYPSQLNLHLVFSSVAGLNFVHLVRWKIYPLRTPCFRVFQSWVPVGRSWNSWIWANFDASRESLCKLSTSKIWSLAQHIPWMKTVKQRNDICCTDPLVHLPVRGRIYFFAGSKKWSEDFSSNVSKKWSEDFSSNVFQSNAINHRFRLMVGKPPMAKWGIDDPNVNSSTLGR